MKMDIKIAQFFARTTGATIGFFVYKYIVFANRKNDLLNYSSQGIAYIFLLIMNIIISTALISFLAKIIHHWFILKITNELIINIEAFFVLFFIFKRINIRKRDTKLLEK